MAEEISIISELHRVLERRPFLPFTIVMSSGERYDVNGLHQVAVGQNVVILLRPGENSIYMRANQISSLEIPDAVN
jgi:hypothetical protein